MRKESGKLLTREKEFFVHRSGGTTKSLTKNGGCQKAGTDAKERGRRENARTED